MHGAERLAGSGDVGPQVDALGRAADLDGQAGPDVRHDLAELAHRGPAHGHVVFLLARRRDGVHAGRMGKHLVLADQGRGGVLGEHEAGVGARVRGQERRQAAGERRVQHPVHPALADAGQLGQGHGQHVRGERQWLAVEVPRRHHLAVERHDRVVHHRAQLDVDHPAGVGQHVPDRAVHLRRAAQAVRVLHRVPAVPVAGQQRRAGQQGPQVGRAVQLARVRAQGLDPLVVGPVGAQQRLDRQGAGDVGHLDQHPRVVDRERQQGLHRLGPVDQGQALLGRQLQRFQAVLGEHLGAGRPRGGSPGPRSLPSPISGWARWASWARSPEAPTEPLLGTTGSRPRLSSSRRRRGRSGRTPEYPAARVLARSRRMARTVASSRGAPVPAACERTMAPCSRARSLQADGGVGQRAEPGVHPVDGGVPLGRGLHHRPAEFHGGGRIRAEFGGGLAAGHVDDILDGEAVAGDDHSSHG